MFFLLVVAIVANECYLWQVIFAKQTSRIYNMQGNMVFINPIDFDILEISKLIKNWVFIYFMKETQSL